MVFKQAGNQIMKTRIGIDVDGVLREISECLDTTLYVLWESDGRFGEENKPFNELIGKSVWNTDEPNPTKEWYLNKRETK